MPTSETGWRVRPSSIWNTDPVVDEISAEIDIVDPRYQDEVASMLDKTHVKEVFHDAPLWRDYSCSADTEVGFIIDSSGSMRKNDPDRFRVTKTEEFLDALGSSNSLASRFNSRGHLLKSLKPAYRGQANHI